MKKDWKDIEGYKVRVDVGSTLAEAMSSSMGAAVICFTTDGHIVLNGISYITSTTEFGELESGLGELTERVDGHDAQIEDINDRIHAVTSDYHEADAILRDRIDGFSEKVDKNAEAITENTNDITALQQTSATLTDKVGTLEMQMDDTISTCGEMLEKVNKHDAQIEDIKSDNRQQQDDIDDLVISAKKTDKALAEHADLINSFYGNLDNLREDIDDNSNRIDRLEKFIGDVADGNANLESFFADYDASFEDHETRIAALEAGGTGGGGDNTALVKRIKALEEQVAALTALLQMA